MSKYIILLLTFFLFTQIGNSKIFNVPAQFSTIQAAIDASDNTDTILVAPGTYNENINFNGKKIMLTSNFLFTKEVNSILNTVIDGGSPGDPNFASCVMIISGEDSTTILQGFTLTNGKGSRWVDEHGAGTYREGGGILIALSSPVIRYNYIVGNEAINKSGMVSAGGGGIRAGDGNPKILNNIISHNKGLYGAGIVLNYTGAIVKNNIVSQNEGGNDFGGGGIWVNNISANNYPIRIENNTIVGNISYLTGGGLRALSTTLSGKNNIIWGNSAVSILSSNVDASGSTAVLSFNCVQGGWTGTGNISSNPLFVNGNQLFLASNSPCVDVGDPALIYNDHEDSANPSFAKFPSLGTLRNDIGVYGGPSAAILPELTFNTKLFFSLSSVGFKQIFIGDSTTIKIDIQNNSHIQAEIDSMVINGNNGISVLYFPQILDSWNSDSLLIKWKPFKAGVIIDTIRIYHNDTTQNNPFILKLTGRPKTPVNVSDISGSIENYDLFQNYPNPFNPSTKIDFYIPGDGRNREFNVMLRVYDILGNEMALLVNSKFSPGDHTVEFEPARYGFSSGIYFYNLNVKDPQNDLLYNRTGKMIYLR